MFLRRPHRSCREKKPICEQAKRIEKLSVEEHELIKELHPQVGEINDGMDVMVAAAKENADEIPPS